MIIRYQHGIQIYHLLLLQAHYCNQALKHLLNTMYSIHILKEKNLDKLIEPPLY